MYYTEKCTYVFEYEFDTMPVYIRYYSMIIEESINILITILMKSCKMYVK